MILLFHFFFLELNHSIELFYIIDHHNKLIDHVLALIIIDADSMKLKNLHDKKTSVDNNAD